jgi:hypothetical protein
MLKFHSKLRMEDDCIVILYYYESHSGSYEQKYTLSGRLVGDPREIWNEAIKNI